MNTTKSQIVLLVSCLVLLNIGLWSIDIGVSGMMVMKAYPETDIIATNGYWFRSPIQQYHLGLWLTLLSGYIIVSESLWLLFQSKSKSIKNQYPRNK